MKPYLKSIVISAVSALLGGALVFLAVRMSPTFRENLIGSGSQVTKNREMVFDDILDKQKDIRQHFDNIFNDDVFSSTDPFDDMRKMREQMRSRMQSVESFGSATNPFDLWFSDKFGGGSIDDISKREDDDYVYYDIKIDDLTSTSVKTQIENGYITITGTVEKKNASENTKEETGVTSQSFYQSTFKRSFPLPEHIDPDKMETLSENGKIVLKFPKIKK